MFQYQYYSPCGNSSVSLLTFDFSLILLIIPGWNFVAYLMNFIPYFGFFLSGGWTHCLAISTAWPRKFVFRISGKLFSDISNLKYSYRKNDKWNCVYFNCHFSFFKNFRIFVVWTRSCINLKNQATEKNNNFQIFIRYICEHFTFFQ